MLIFFIYLIIKLCVYAVDVQLIFGFFFKLCQILAFQSKYYIAVMVYSRGSSNKKKERERERKRKEILRFVIN